jgi:hypothetical protein
MILVADAIDPGNIPDSFRLDRNRGVNPYTVPPFDRAWTHQLRRWPRRIGGIDTTGGHPEAACCLDVERYDATAGMWPEWRAERDRLVTAGKAHGFTTVYCSINPGAPYGVAQVAGACAQAGQGLPAHWWVAWYTPGGFIPAAQQVCDEIKRLTRLVIDPAAIWGCQCLPDQGAGYDVSVVYQNPEWVAA